MQRITLLFVPIVNKIPLKGSRNIPCPSCGNFLEYVYSETLYVCPVCGKQFLPQEILAKYNIQRQKEYIPTKKEIIKEEYGDLLEQMENYDPEELMRELEEKDAP